MLRSTRRENLTPSIGRVETKTANLDENHRWRGMGEGPVDTLVKADVSSRKDAAREMRPSSSFRRNSNSKEDARGMFPHTPPA